MTFIIGDRVFSAATLPNGISRLNINLNPGNYIIQAINPVTGEIAYNNLKIFNRLMDSTDLTQNYGENKYYTIRAYTGDGKVVGAGEIVIVNVDGKTYNLKTNQNGYVSLKINLKPGTYILTASYGGVTVKNKIIVKSLINAKNVSVKSKTIKSIIKSKKSKRKLRLKFLLKRLMANT